MNVCVHSWPLNNPTPQRSNVLNLRHSLIGNLLKGLNVLGLRRAPYMSRTQASATDPSLDRGLRPTLRPTLTLMFAPLLSPRSISASESPYTATGDL